MVNYKERNYGKLRENIKKDNKRKKRGVGKYLIEEYKEIGELLRFNGSWRWVCGTIFMPVSLSCFYIITRVNSPLDKLLIALASTFLIWFWVALSFFKDISDNVRYDRARDIEEILCLGNYSLGKLKLKTIFIKIKLLRLVFASIITLGWLIWASDYFGVVDINSTLESLIEERWHHGRR